MGVRLGRGEKKEDVLVGHILLTRCFLPAYSAAGTTKLVTAVVMVPATQV